MDTTILTEVLRFIGVSVASGLTWDLIKSKGKGLLDSFEKRFVKYFIDKVDAEKFFQTIAEKELCNTDDPYIDVKMWYKNRKGQQDSQKFMDDFVDWVKENQTQFSDLVKQNRPTGTVIIKKQTAKDKSTITNIGTQINNK